MKRRNFLAGATAAMVAQDAIADEFAEAATALKSGANSIKLLAPEGCESNLAPIVNRWFALTGIAVEIDIVGVDEINDRMTVDHLAQRANYDVALPATFGLADLAWAGTIQPLDTILSKQGTALNRHEGIYPQGDRYGGKRYGFQTDGDAYLMFYRNDWLKDESFRKAYADQFGTELAKPNSWEELDQQMQFFHVPAQDRFGGALFRNPGYLAWEFWSRMHAKGVLPFDDEFTPQLATSGAVAALSEMIRATEFLHPATRSAGLFENWDIFASGTSYCNIGWGGSQKYFNRDASAIKGKLCHGLLPGGATPNLSYFNWGWSYVIPTTSASPEIGTLFAAFAVSPEISTVAVREAGGYFDPFHEMHYADPAIIRTYSPEFLEVHKAAMSEPVPDLYLPGHGSYFDKLARRLREAFEGQHSPQHALDNAVRDWELVTLDFDREEQKARWAELRNMYPAALTRS